MSVGCGIVLATLGEFMVVGGGGKCACVPSDGRAGFRKTLIACRKSAVETQRLRVVVVAETIGGGEQ